MTNVRTPYPGPRADSAPRGKYRAVAPKAQSPDLPGGSEVAGALDAFRHKGRVRESPQVGRAVDCPALRTYRDPRGLRPRVTTRQEQDDIDRCRDHADDAPLHPLRLGFRIRRHRANPADLHAYVWQRRPVPAADLAAVRPTDCTPRQSRARTRRKPRTSSGTQTTIKPSVTRKAAQGTESAIQDGFSKTGRT